MEAVTEILLERGRETRRVAPMATLSFAVHLTGAVLLVLVPGVLGGRREAPVRDVMTISLGGAPGPRAGGMTPMGGRPIEAVQAPAVPVPEAVKPQPIRPPTPKAPEMTLPKPGTKPILRPPARPAAVDPRGRKPPTAMEAQPGSAVADTGARGVGFGLTTGGGAAGGYLDVGNFCCPDYLTTMIQLVQRNWNSKQQIGADNMVKFTILRDGNIVGVALERSSGYAALDLTSQRALLMTKQLPPLPTAFPNETLTVHLRFQYQP